MNLTISHLHQLSGVPIHTIRIWERRYHALTPLRSEGNTRHYTDEHLRRLLDIVSLNQAGIKISVACAYTPIQIDEFLRDGIEQTIHENATYEFYIAQMLKFGLSYNEYQFNSLLTRCIRAHGLKTSYREIILPLLQRVGLMWRRTHLCPAQEHFLSGIIRQKLMSAIDVLPIKNKQKGAWLLFLPEDEDHDIPLLYASYLLRSNGFNVIYLGSHVPLESVNDAMIANNVANLLLFMTRQRPIVEANAYLEQLSHQADGVQIHLAGNTTLIGSLNLGTSVNWLNSIEAFELQLSKISHVN